MRQLVMSFTGYTHFIVTQPLKKQNIQKVHRPYEFRKKEPIKEELSPQLNI